MSKLAQHFNADWTGKFCFLFCEVSLAGRVQSHLNFRVKLMLMRTPFKPFHGTMTMLRPNVDDEWLYCFPNAVALRTWMLPAISTLFIANCSEVRNPWQSNYFYWKHKSRVMLREQSVSQNRLHCIGRGHSTCHDACHLPFCLQNRTSGIRVNDWNFSYNQYPMNYYN